MRRDRIRPFQCTWEKIDSVDESHASLPLLILGHLALAYCRRSVANLRTFRGPSRMRRRDYDLGEIRTTGTWKRRYEWNRRKDVRGRAALRAVSSSSRDHGAARRRARRPARSSGQVSSFRWRRGSGRRPAAPAKIHDPRLDLGRGPVRQDRLPAADLMARLLAAFHTDAWKGK